MMPTLPVPPWPADGPVTTRGPDGRLSWLKPTLTNATSERTDGRCSVISDRADQRIHFSYTVDGVHVSYEATVSQDDLFRILHDAGVFTPRVLR